MASAFAALPQGFQRVAAGATHARHRHAGAYAAIVLGGSYEEAGLRGRFRMRPGDVLFHAAFESHCDRFGACDAQILNLPLPDGFAANAAAGCCRDVDGVVRLAKRDAREAAALLDMLEPVAPLMQDWPDLLAADLARDPSLALSDWAARHRLTPESLSRGLRRTYGVAPARLRRELRAQHAWRLVTTTSLGIARIAQDCGFADQAHMTRDVALLTGRAPGQWRKRG
jgi:AraC-like DNA-binding protein